MLPVIIVIVFIINSRLERNILIEGEFPSKDQEIAIYNSRFISYGENNISQAAIKSLINTIIYNNATSSQHIVKITFNNATCETNTEITKLLKNNMINSEKYNCHYEYDLEGFINNIIIEEAIK